MTIVDDFMIGPTLEEMKTLEEWGITVVPDASYRSFAVADRLGDGSIEGNGSAMPVWHFAGMYPGEADILANMLNGNLSAFVYYRTRANRLNEAATDYKWLTYSGFMNWATGEENVPALHELDLTITFTGNTLIPDYPYP